MKIKEIWIIDDPLDGIHVYKSSIAANKDLLKWRKQARDDMEDSVWEMKGPFKFIRTDK
jgi:hypothetical protein